MFINSHHLCALAQAIGTIASGVEPIILHVE